MRCLSLPDTETRRTMHGRARHSLAAESSPQVQQQLAESRKKAKKLRQLQTSLLQWHRDHCYDEAAIAGSAALLEANPDLALAWNFRKLAFLHRWHQRLPAAQTGGPAQPDEARSGSGNDDASASGDQPQGCPEDAEEDEATRKRRRALEEAELRLVESALAGNPKAYGPWHHRKWLLALAMPLEARAPPASDGLCPETAGSAAGQALRGPAAPAPQQPREGQQDGAGAEQCQPPPPRQVSFLPGVARSAVTSASPLLARTRTELLSAATVAREMKLLRRLLALDDRNFHAWDYWRFLCVAAQVPLAAQLAFSLERVNANFSNYSAWHARSLLHKAATPPLSSPSPSPSPSWLPSELLLLRQAFFTEPEDQSAWLCLPHLLRCAAPPAPPRLLACLLTAQTRVSAPLPGPPVVAAATGASTRGLPAVLLLFSEAVRGVSCDSVSVTSQCFAAQEWRAGGWAGGKGDAADGSAGSRVWSAVLQPLPSCALAAGLGETPQASGARSGIQQHHAEDSTARTAGHHSSAEALGVPSDGTNPASANPSSSPGAALLLGPSSRLCPHGLSVRISLPSAVASASSGLSLAQGLSGGAEEGSGSEAWEEQRRAAVALVEAEMEALEELMEMEEGSKWPSLSFARLLLARASLEPPSSPQQQQPPQPGPQAAAWRARALSLLSSLPSVDPMREEFYRHLLRQAESTGGAAQAEAAPGALSWRGRGLRCVSDVPLPVSPATTSLSLDLSGNAIAFASALNSLFAALQGVQRGSHPPLSLRLNLSHNCLGSHTVDTFRYHVAAARTNCLCLAPVSLPPQDLSSLSHAPQDSTLLPTAAVSVTVTCPCALLTAAGAQATSSGPSHHHHQQQQLAQRWLSLAARQPSVWEALQDLRQLLLCPAVADVSIELDGNEAGRGEAWQEVMVALLPGLVKPQG